MERYTNKTLVSNMIGISEDDVQDDWLDWATAQVDARTFQTFADVEVVERYDGSGCDELLLNHSPIISISKIEYLQDGHMDVWLEFDKDYTVFYADEGRLRLVEDVNGQEHTSFYRGVQNWKITYKYGYSEIPRLVELLATLLVIELYQIKRDGASGVVASERIGAYSISYATSGAVVPVKNLIEELVTKLRVGNIGVVGL